MIDEFAIKGAFDSLFEAARPILEFLGILPDEAERAQMKLVEVSEENVKNLEREIAIATASGEEAKKLFDLKKQLIEEELLLLEEKGAEEEEIFNKTTELLTLEATERTRLHNLKLQQAEEERIKNEEIVAARHVQTVNTIEGK